MKVDRYGRSLCLVRVAQPSRPADPPTLYVGLSMVSAGRAWRYRAYAREGLGGPGQVRGGRAGRLGPARGPVGRSWPCAAVGVVAERQGFKFGSPVPLKFVADSNSIHSLI